MGEPIRILQVDDDPDFLDVAATFLEREDERFEVETATSAELALERLTESVDCVLSDYEMPGTDGVELLETVREEHPDLPFVLFTGKGGEEVASEAISAGVTDYLQKETGTSQYTVLANRVANAVEQHRSKRELQASRKRLSLFFEQSPLGVVEWNEDFEFARVNEAAEEILGYDEDELRGTEWGVAVPESELPAVDEVTSALLEDEAGYHSVNENVRADGERIVCEWHNRVITDEAGDVVAIFSQFQDVTERKEREWQLERHRENLEGLHEAANRLYAAESVAACYDIMIDAAVTILGFDWCTLAAPAEDEPDTFEIRAISAETPLSVGDRPFGVSEGIAGKVYQTKEPIVVDDVHETGDGEPTDDDIRAALTVPVADWGIFQAVSTSPDAFDDQDRKHAELLVASMLAAVERIEQQTELRERQRALERQNDRLDEFASVVSHDLRNPLTVAEGRLGIARTAIEASSVVGDGATAAGGAEPEAGRDIDVAEQLDAVKGAHERMQTLIEDLLALARNGETPAEIATIDLPTVATESWAAVDTADATLSVDTDASIRADETRLRQLFENCFRNAIEHAGDDVAVEIGAVTDNGGSFAGFFVEDDGPGIPPGRRDHLFEMGYSTSDAGTGLGLSIVADVADAHDWTVRATDGEHGGARFEVTGVEAAD